jgi:spore germination protein GerM
VTRRGARNGVGASGTSALILCLVAACACAAPSGPVVIPASELPFPVTRPSTASPSAWPTRDTIVYLTRLGRLEGVVRQVPRSISAPMASLDALLAGPTATERADAIGTAVPPQTRLLGTRVLDGVAEVDLSEEFQETADPRTILLRVAQLVWTLVAQPDVSAVRFQIDGEPIAVLTDRGDLTDRPVTSVDFASVAPAST